VSESAAAVAAAGSSVISSPAASPSIEVSAAAPSIPIALPPVVIPPADRPRGWLSYFAQRDVHAHELPAIMRKHIYTGAMGNVYGSLVTGVFFTFYGQAIGLSVLGWGGLLGVSSFLIAGQILSAFVTQRLGRRKVVWFLCEMTSRLLRLAAVLVSYWLWRHGAGHVGFALMVLVWLSNLFGTMAQPPWLSWLADIIPEQHHGGFWGRRSQLIAVIVLAAVFPAAWFVDWAPEHLRIPAMLGVFCAAAVVGIIDLLIHGTIPEPAMVAPRRHDFLQHLLAPLRDRGFRPWLVFTSLWTFGMTFGGSLNFFHWLTDLGLRNNLMAAVLVMLALPMLGNLVVSRHTGRLVDRLGPKRVLLWGHTGWALLPAFWLFPQAGSWMAFVWLGVAGFWGSLWSTPASIAANKLITRYPPAADRAMYVAVSTCLASIAGGFGPIFEGLMVNAIGQAWTWQVAGFTFVAFHVAYVVSLVLRLLTARLLIPRVNDPVAGSGNGAGAPH
jgi:MFS family permease